MEHITFDGVRLTDMYDVTATRGIATPRVETETVAGRDGVVVREVTYEPPPVTITIIGRVGFDTDKARRELAELFSVREPKVLQFSGDDGRYYMAVPSELDWSKFVTLGRLTVEFTIPDAAMYGERRSVTVPSGGQARIVTGGTYPTGMKIEGTVTRNASSKLWGIQLDDADFIHIDTGSDSPRAISIDTERRVAKVSGSVTLPTLDSDWLHIEAGVHTLRNDQGSGAVVVSWVERWL